MQKEYAVVIHRSTAQKSIFNRSSLAFLSLSKQAWGKQKNMHKRPLSGDSVSSIWKQNAKIVVICVKVLTDIG